MTSSRLSSTSRLALGAAFSLACMAGARAIEAGPIAIHGSLSATASYSDSYDFQGNTKDRVDLNVIEFTLNAAHQFENGLRASAQLYAYELEGYRDVALDFATLNYSFHESFGVRVGRNKIPLGLYGEVLDVDMLRPFAFLPLDVYQKSFRPLGAAYDGAGLFGTLPLKAAGSLEYQLNYGWVVGSDEDEPFFKSSESNTPSRTESSEAGTVASAALFWNTPVSGLRAGVSFFDAHDIELTGPMRRFDELPLLNGDARGLAYVIPQVAWDALIAPHTGTLKTDYARHAVSLEYTRDRWQYAAEYFWADVDGINHYPQPLGDIPLKERLDAYYGMVTYQATDRLQLGAYYAESFANKYDRDGSNVMLVQSHTAYIKDLAVAASFSLRDWWLLKFEVHQLRGTKSVSAAGNGDAARWEPDWNYIVLKSTISF